MYEVPVDWRQRIVGIFLLIVCQRQFLNFLLPQLTGYVWIHMDRGQRRERTSNIIQQTCKTKPITTLSHSESHLGVGSIIHNFSFFRKPLVANRCL